MDLAERIFALKDELREGWLLRGIDRPESVADHSWGTAILCLLHASEAGADRARSVEMALVHDLAEAVTGDSATRVSGLTGEQKKLQKTRKQEREARAMDELRALGLPERVFESWREYEEAETAEAIFVRDMNLIDMCAQALIYERGGRYREEELGSNFPEFEGLSEFFETTRMRLATEIGRSLFTGLEDEYRSLRAGGR